MIRVSSIFVFYIICNLFSDLVAIVSRPSPLFEEDFSRSPPLIKMPLLKIRKKVLFSFFFFQFQEKIYFILITHVNYISGRDIFRLNYIKFRFYLRLSRSSRHVYGDFSALSCHEPYFNVVPLDSMHIPTFGSPFLVDSTINKNIKYDLENGSKKKTKKVNAK